MLEKKYRRYIYLTAGANKLLQENNWDGNLNEIYSFCERLVILSPKRTVNESIIHSLMDICLSVAHKDIAVHGASVSNYDEKATRLVALLEKHHGKRQLVAKEMKISATTLWRYMKKYGIGNK